MEIWKRTDMVWTEEYTTDIEISTWWNQRESRKPPHSFKFRVNSQPDGSGYGQIIFNPRSRSGLCPKDQLIVVERFKDVESLGFTIQWERSDLNREWYNGFAYFSFRLKNGEPFTDKAISIAYGVAKALGLIGKSLLDYLARFQVSQNTFVQYGGKWIGFGDYLRHKHHLPSLSGTGWSDTN